jgi:hypothetical protein
MILLSREIRFLLHNWISVCILTAVALYPLQSFSQYSVMQKGLEAGKYPTEELYVVTDRDIYISGENVCLKVFSLNRLTHKPSDLSKVVYISLLDHSANPVVQVKIGLNGSSGSGKFTLPDTLRTGSYFIGSCTHWMQNYSPDFYSYKKISVVNPFQKIDQFKIRSHEPVADTIIFYPESGRIVLGCKTNIGFRCLDKNMDPLEVNGSIVNGKNDTLCRVATNKSGYGLFSIHPEDTDKLYLIPSARSLSAKSFSLPAVSSEGISFTIENNKEQQMMKIRILKSLGFNGSGRRFYLVYNTFSIPPFIKEFVPGKDTEITLQKISLPPGLASLSITDDNEQILAKRFIYNKIPEPVFKVRVAKTDFLIRDQVRVEISSENQTGDPVESDLTVSVVKSFAHSDADVNSLCSFIQIPGPAGDNLGIGYSDINDQLIFYSGSEGFFSGTDNPGTEPKYLPEPEGHLVSGTILSTTTGKPLPGEDLILSIVGKSALCKFTKTDENGAFNFNIKESGNREIVIQPLRSDLNNYYIEINNPFPMTFNKYQPAPFFIDTGKIDAINSAVISMQVNALYEPMRSNGSVKTKQIDKPAFYGQPQYEVLLADFIELTSLKEVIKELVPVAFIDTRKGKNTFNLITNLPGKNYLTNPFILVDGVAFYNHDAVIKIPPAEIEKIDVLNSRYYISDISLEGIIDIKTKKGNLSVAGLEMPVFRQEFEAPSSGTGFRAPEYLNAGQKNSRIPDLRNTLYWNPDIRTDRNGKAYTEFYTSDEGGSYTITVEGITKAGAKGKSTTEFTVSSK